jgi:ATP-dependent Lon protease
MDTRVSKAIGNFSPNRAARKSTEDNLLLDLRREIAALRVKSEAAKAIPAGDGATIVSTLPMVPIFATPLPDLESLNADRDVQRRQERIRKVLSERGAMRLLGAIATDELEHALTALYDSHPNFAEATTYVLGELALARQKGRAVVGVRLLLSGDAGTGKTDYSLTLSKILGVPSSVIGMSSAQASAALAGSETYWSNSEPGLIWTSLVNGQYANPLIVLDELEKASTAWGDPGGALYQVLEPRTASSFVDKSVPWLPVDASHVSWVATVNSPERLHPAIRSRFVEVHVQPPSEACLRKVIQRLYLDLLSEFDLVGRFPEVLGEESESALLGVSIRDAKRMLRAAVAVALRVHADQVVVQPENRRDQARRIGFI